MLIPLTYKQLKGMRALQALQPQIKELQAKYKNDKQRMQQEMMRFYQREQSQPASPPASRCWRSCRSSSRSSTCCRTSSRTTSAARRASAALKRRFFFINDLTAKATGGELIALLIIYVGTQLISGLVMAVTADKSQRMLMFALPLIFVPFIISFPAGLILYWITTNIWTIGQQFVIQQIIPAPVLATPEEVAAAKPPPPPPKRKKKRR